MSLSGFLYVAIVVGWAVYLVPFALKRYDEASRNRSIDRFSSAMRVLGRHEVDAEAAEAAGLTRPVPAASPPVRRAAQKAARRRRRVLLLLLLVTGAAAGVAAAGLAPWWSVAVPGVLVLLWLMVCRGQARRDRREHGVPRAFAGWDAHDVPAPGSEVVPDEALLAEPGETPLVDPGEVVVQPAGCAPADIGVDLDVEAPPADDEPTVVLSREGIEAEEAEPAGAGNLWDPVPVTLPTYVHKPRAPRTTRTIDLGSSDVQSSGRKYEESAIYTHHVDPASLREPHDQDAEQQAQSDEQKPTRRAVGE